MRIFSIGVIVSAAVAVGACASTTPPPTSPAEVGEAIHGSGYKLVNGYLPKEDRVDSLALLPAPPEDGTVAMDDDMATHRALSAFRDTPRGEIARQDAKLSFPADEETPFSCALGIPISEATTPHLNILLRRVLTDAGTATFGAKDNYKRTRPFVALEESSCTPDEEHILANDGSYPSGHTAAGWAQVVILAEIAPDRSDALLQRGRAYGQSRAICGAHWKSDIINGRLVADATVLKLHNDPQFRAQMEAARKEVAALRAAGVKPVSDCEAEAAALATTSKMAP